MTVAAPGTILQRLYLRERVRHLSPGRFIEVGVGRGDLSAELLRFAWRGEGWDLNEEAVRRATETNAEAVKEGRYAVFQGNWLDESGGTADLVISSMVIEHLSDDREASYFDRCRKTLTPEGRAIVFVPASPRHWGIEDEIAGHVRRYTREALRERLFELGFQIEHLAGLTFPLSNALLPLSNVLVRRAEAHKRLLSEEERTRESGIRQVPFKTTFPRVVGLILNEHVLYPFHLLQKATSQSERALVLYSEATPLR
jgi:SAM-dependent methyltransferase